MKRFLAMALLIIASSSAFAADVYFKGGLVYRSEYNDQIGRASLVMTGNPEYVMISTDQNKCKDGMCNLTGFGDDISSALYRLVKVQDQNNQIKYKAIPVPLTELGRKMYIPEYESDLNQIKITIDTSISWENSNGGNQTFRMPKAMTLKVEYKGRTRQYELTQIDSIRI